VLYSDIEGPLPWFSCGRARYVVWSLAISMGLLSALKSVSVVGISVGAAKTA
jgi:hypothetical protein